MLVFFLTLTYFSISSTNPTEVSHFILKKLIVKSSNNPPFLRMMISYQILRAVPSLESLKPLAHHRNVAS